MLLRTYRATSHSLDTWKKILKIWQKKLSNPKTEVFFEIFKKKKCEFMCYTWYESIQHWHHWHCWWWQKTLDPRLVLQKISQYCPKTRKLRVSTLRAHDVTSNLVLVCFEFGRNFLQNGLRISAQPFKHTVQTDLSLLKNIFILNVLGLKNSTDFKENTKYYINLPIFEHFRC